MKNLPFLSGNPKVLSAPDVVANCSKYCLAISPMCEGTFSSSSSSSFAVIDENCGNVMTFCRFSSPSNNWFHFAVYTFF